MSSWLFDWNTATTDHFNQIMFQSFSCSHSSWFSSCISSKTCIVHSRLSGSSHSCSLHQSALVSVPCSAAAVLLSLSSHPISPRELHVSLVFIVRATYDPEYVTFSFSPSLTVWITVSPAVWSVSQLLVAPVPRWMGKCSQGSKQHKTQTVISAQGVCEKMCVVTTMMMMMMMRLCSIILP